MLKNKRLRIGTNGPYRLVLQSVTLIFCSFFFFSYEFSTRLYNILPAQPYRLFFTIISPYRITTRHCVADRFAGDNRDKFLYYYRYAFFEPRRITTRNIILLLYLLLSEGYGAEKNLAHPGPLLIAS